MSKVIPCILALLVCCALGATDVAGQADAVCNQLELGSLLVFPLIDNINFSTVVQVVNAGDAAVSLRGYLITHGTGDPCSFRRQNFEIHLTAREPFWWDTSRGRHTENRYWGNTSIPEVNGRKGFCVMWAVNDNKEEVTWNKLLGHALAIRRKADVNTSFRYEAYAQQRLVLPGDPDPNLPGELHLDGQEYCMGSGLVSFGAISAGYGPVEGVIAVCGLNMDLSSGWQDFFVAEDHWNESESPGSMHGIDVCGFRQLDLRYDLDATLRNIGSPTAHIRLSSADAIWAVFYQTAGQYAWGGNVYQHCGQGRPAVLMGGN